MGNVQSCGDYEEETKVKALECCETPTPDSRSKQMTSAGPGVHDGTPSRTLGKKRRLRSLSAAGHAVGHLGHSAAGNISHAVGYLSHAVGHLFHSVDEFFFPPHSLLGVHDAKPHVSGCNLLDGCQTPDEHYAKISHFMHLVKNLHAEEGLRTVGFEYRFVPCSSHDKVNDHDSENHEGELVEEDEIHLWGGVLDLNGATPRDLEAQGRRMSPVSSRPDLVATEVSTGDSAAPGECGNGISNSFHGKLESSTAEDNHVVCEECSTKLFHIGSNTMLHRKNRKKFIADGEMYDEVARLCQEYAISVMQREGDLVWITVCDDQRKGATIRALVSKEHTLAYHDTFDGAPRRPTLLVATGSGKVRAGVFSREHLMLSGLECSTALPMVREAKRRDMNIAMIDPNVRTDRQGMHTFEASMAKIFAHWEIKTPYSAGDEDEFNPSFCRDLYILSHSASGAQLARYLLEKEEHYLPHIRAVAFTDSTHNIQWARDHHALYNLLQSSICAYFRCAKQDDDQWYLHAAGEKVPPDPFWQRRFGTIQTYWAGTNEHSLTNWCAHSHIWKHFDHFLERSFSECTSRAHAIKNS